MKKSITTNGYSRKMKLSLKFEDWEIQKLWESGAGSFLKAQTERFEVASDLDLNPLDMCKGDSQETCSLLWSESFLEAKIVADFYRSKKIPVVLLWDMRLEKYCNWIKCSIENVSSPSMKGA